MLNLDRLATLCAFADHGGLAATARALHLSESAVSQQLTRLQAETGHELLTRVGRRLRLTATGERLVADSRALLDDLRRIEDSLGATAAEPTGTVVVAAFATAIRTLVLRAMADLSDTAPGVTIRVVEGEPHDAIGGLRRGEVDLAVTNHWHQPPEPDPGLVSVALLEDPVVVAVARDDPLAAAASVGLADLAGNRLVSWPQGTVCRQWLAGALARHGVELTVAHDALEHETLMALVAAGHGIAVLPRLGCEEGRVRLVPVEGEERRWIEAVIRRGARRHPSVVAVLDALRRASGA